MIPFLILLFSFSTVTAQESTNTAGGNASGGGGSVSYSVGQPVYHAYSATNGSVAEGVQQAFEISVVTAIEEAKTINLLVRAYPNPATDHLTLEVKNFKLSGLTFQLYDMNGRLLQNEKITESQTSISMGQLVPATYFVKVIQDTRDVKTFKIIKN
ncbi:T9SS type A sorting domain-containing protein [Maribellus sp. YY47]|uniref:T9SS type A sorting domain-containing protein n=1 Tax=Maribellus sp. YY47 TaxID=2929486 RepID=UPI002001B83C|nr:T9SS type A sorting domain-containing protein [Maribellus sp. YY47]